MPQYRVERLRMGRFVWEFQTAHDVAIYMWGRDFTKYRIYKRGVRFFWADGDLHAFEAALELF